MSVLPIFPLYPSPSFLKFNVSLAIPGPKLWDLPKIGRYAESHNYPNTQSAILIPDIEYIKRFANYELGISNAMLKISQQQNTLRIKLPEVKSSFDSLYGNSDNKTGAFKGGMGFEAMEKTILSSIFETQKPYFEIAQFAIKSLVKIEDIIARIAPLVGAGVNPTMVKSIKSRKPKGNGPQISGGILGPFGSPQAIGYQKGKDINSKIDEMSTQLQRGDGVDINKDGKYTKIPKFTTQNNTLPEISSSIQFSYITVSTIYSTGIFNPNIEYTYKYIDLKSDEILQPISTSIPNDEIDKSPDRIIIGIYNSTGTVINPNDKIDYWGVDFNGSLERQTSIFEKAPWIKGEKWIFDKCIDDPSLNSWKTLEEELYKWRKDGQIITSNSSPGNDWEKIKYSDVIDFNNSDNQYLEYKKDDYIVEFTQNTVDTYRIYYDYFANQSMNKQNVLPEDRPDIISQIEKLYSESSPNDKILSQLQDLIKFGEFKSSYYGDTDYQIDQMDWTIDNNPPIDRFPDSIRKVFKPMRFNIEGEIVWIDPELDYDLKVIRVDPSLKLNYSNISTDNQFVDLQRNSNITNFIKNSLDIKVYDDTTNSNSFPNLFSIEVYKNGSLIDSKSNIDIYNLTNWNIDFNSLTGQLQQLSNQYQFIVYLQNAPSIFQSSNIFMFDYTGHTFYVNNNYDNGTDQKSGWIVDSFVVDLEVDVKKISNINNNYHFELLTFKYIESIVYNPILYAEYEALSTLSTNYFSAGDILNGIDYANQASLKLDDSKEIYKYYTISSTTPSNNEFISTNIISKIKLELSNGLITKWILWDQIIDSTSQFNNISILPGFYKRNLLNINPYKNSLTEYTNIQIDTLPKFQIQISDNTGAIQVNKVLNKENYTIPSLNDNISELNKFSKSFSKGKYGSGSKGGVCLNESGSPVLNADGTAMIEPDDRQYVGYLRRSQLTELDNESYYIIEGIKKTKNEELQNTSGNQSSPSSSPNSTSSGGGYYKISHALGIIKVMIELVIELGTKLFPAINKLISLIKNPASFITEIIKSKIEDHFIIFNPKVIQILQQLPSYKSKITSASSLDKKDRLKEMRDFVKQTELGNYIFVEENGDFRSVLDGPALVGFFGILFGLELNLTKSVPIKPIFSTDLSLGNIDSFIDKFKQENPNSNIKIDPSNKSSGKLITNNVIESDLNKKLVDLDNPIVEKNRIIYENGQSQFYEEVSIVYSTGKFIEGVDYKYIYIDQQIERLIKEADDLISKNVDIEFSGTASNSLDELKEASEKYQQAYDMIDRNDNSKDSLKKLLLDNIKSIKDKINALSQPLLKMILGIVNLPLKVVFGIIKWLLDFFKKLTNPIEFPSLIAEFLSFKWIMQFFTPKGLLDLAGIKFNPDKVREWSIAVKTKNPLFGKIAGVSEYLIPDDFVIADLNEFLSVGFEVTLPTYTAKQYRDLQLRPLRLFSAFLCLIERIINAFIMLIWSIMGITAVIPPPLIKLCNNIPENIKPEDLQDLLNGLYKDFTIAPLNANGDPLTTEELKNTGNGESYDFIYDVKLPDGSVKKELDRESLQSLIDANIGVNFDFTNFTTL